MSFYGKDYPDVADVDPYGDDDPQETPAELARRLFPRIDWRALWEDDEREEWIHEPLLPVGRSVSIYSAPKVGKSLLILEMAVAISRGEIFLGYQPTRRWHVLYVDFENDPRGDVRTRLQAMGYKPDDLDQLDYLSFPTMAGLDSERGALELLEAVKAYSSEVVIIDTVSRAVDGEENSNDTWLAMYRHTGLALKRAGVAVIRLDHPGKDESKGARGGSAKSGDVDAIWKLSRVTDSTFRLECTESRMAITTKSLLLTRHAVPRLHHGVNAISGVTDHQAKVAAIVQLLDSNGIPFDATREAIRSFVGSRGIKASGKVIQAVVKARKDAGSTELTPEFTTSDDDPESAELTPKFSEFTDGPKRHDLSTDQVNSGVGVQQSSPGHGTTELPGSSTSTARGSSPVQAGSPVIDPQGD